MVEDRRADTRGLFAQLEGLLALATDGQAGGSRVESAVACWSVRELLAADELFRRAWFGYRDGELSGLGRAAVAGVRDAIWLASMARDGRLRERAVTALAADSSVMADRLLAVRLDDPVAEVGSRAWAAVVARCRESQAVQVGPVVIALRRRWRASGAAEKYATLYADRVGEPLWTALQDSPDRPTRRWAMARRIADHALPTEEALRLLPREHDQVVATALVEVVVRSADRRALTALLTSRHAAGRAAALDALPNGDVSDAALVSALLDRASRVRRSGQAAARHRGLDPAGIYIRHWEERHEPRALQGAVEAGARYDPNWWRTLLADPDSRVRNIAIGELGRLDLDPADIENLLSLLDDPASWR